MNAIHCPSGDQTGRTSHAREPTSLVAFPPATGTVYRSPNRSKTNVLPSGEISRLISVASVVVKVTDRPPLDSHTLQSLAIPRTVNTRAFSPKAHHQKDNQALNN